MQQHIAMLNARIQNVNLAQNDLLREIEATIKMFASINAALEKENAELQDKKKEKTK